MNYSADKTIKILCVCQKGESRSVGTRHRLVRRGYRNVIAIGCENTNSETLRMLCEWADLILLAKPEQIAFLPVCANKVIREFSIGPDLWGAPRHPQLQEIIKKQLNALGLR